MQRVDFGRSAPVYDQLRGAILAHDHALRLIDAAALRGATVLDVGGGTGRISLAFAQLESSVIVLDSSVAMLNKLREKSGTIPVNIVVGDCSAQPFASCTFDAVVIARLLYLISDWQRVLSEALRLLKPGGRLLHEWGNGQEDEPWAQIRDHARALFENAGVPSPFHPGARTEAQVDREIAQLGLELVDRVSFGPGEMVPLSKVLEGIRAGHYSYTWNVPEPILADCLPQLESWAAGQFDMGPVPMPREIVWNIYSKPADRLE